MEQISPRFEYYKLESDITAKNAQVLNTMREVTLVSVTEQIRRAAALYNLAVDMFDQGGSIQSVFEDKTELIPLFYQPSDDEPSVSLTVNINKETAELFKKLGVNSNNNDTFVLDNVIHHYHVITDRYLSGHKIITESSSGVKREMELLI